MEATPAPAVQGEAPVDSDVEHVDRPATTKAARSTSGMDLVLPVIMELILIFCLFMHLLSYVIYASDMDAFNASHTEPDTSDKFAELFAKVTPSELFTGLNITGFVGFVLASAFSLFKFSSRSNIGLKALTLSVILFTLNFYLFAFRVSRKVTGKSDPNEVKGIWVTFAALSTLITALALTAVWNVKIWRRKIFWGNPGVIAMKVIGSVAIFLFGWAYPVSIMAANAKAGTGMGTSALTVGSLLILGTHIRSYWWTIRQPSQGRDAGETEGLVTKGVDHGTGNV